MKASLVPFRYHARIRMGLDRRTRRNPFTGRPLPAVVVLGAGVHVVDGRNLSKDSRTAVSKLAGEKSMKSTRLGLEFTTFAPQQGGGQI